MQVDRMAWIPRIVEAVGGGRSLDLKSAIWLMGCWIDSGDVTSVGWEAID
jgi:hypothetical protein